MLDIPKAVELLEGGNAPLGTFSARINACYFLGLISDDEHHDLNQMRRIRNAFAHDFHTSFETESVVDRCRTLRNKAHDYVNKITGEVKVSPSDQFRTTAVSLILDLVNRPSHVSKQRCTVADWPPFSAPIE